MANENPFNNGQICDLGVTGLYGPYGVDIQTVSDTLSSQTTPLYIQCRVCGQPAVVHAVPMDSKKVTADMALGGYFCNHCVNKLGIPHRQLKIRRLEER